MLVKPAVSEKRKKRAYVYPSLYTLLASSFLIHSYFFFFSLLRSPFSHIIIITIIIVITAVHPFFAGQILRVNQRLEAQKLVNERHGKAKGQNNSSPGVTSTSH